MWDARAKLLFCSCNLQFSFFFFSHVLVVVASLDLKVPNVQWANNSSVCALRKWANFTLTWERGRQGDKHYYDPTIYLYSSNVHSLLLTNWVTWYKGQKVRNEEKSTFFHIFFSTTSPLSDVLRSLFLCHGSLRKHSFFLTECYWAAGGQPTSLR